MRHYIHHAGILDLVVVGRRAFAWVSGEGMEDEAVVGGGEAQLRGELDCREDDLLMELLEARLVVCRL